MELEQSQMAWEQDATALNQARDAQRKSEATRQENIEDLAKLGRVMSAAMAGLCASIGPVTPNTLVESGATQAWFESLSWRQPGEQCIESSLCSSCTTKG
jgi:hypothetical protein